MNRLALASLLLLVAACPASGSGESPDSRTQTDGEPTADAGTDAVDPPAIDAAPAVVTVHTYLREGSRAATPANPPWMAVQDGDGAFTPVTGTDGVYAVTVRDRAGRYGVAVQCPDNAIIGGRNVRVVQATASEGADLHIVCALGLPTTVQATVTPRGCQRATVKIGAASWSGLCGNDEAFTIMEGAFDVVGVTDDAEPRVFVQRGFSGGSVAVDFESPTESAAMTNTSIHRDREDTPWDLAFVTPTTMWTRPGRVPTIPGVPASLRGPGDIHHLTVHGPDDVDYFYAQPREIDATSLPPAVSLRMSATKSQVSWTTEGAIGFTFSSAWSLSVWTVHVSSAWLAGATSYTSPRLCELDGFIGRCIGDSSVSAWYMHAYYPLHGAAPRFLDIANADELPAVARDGLTYVTAHRSVDVE
jgi:hypothetical protein